MKKYTIIFDPTRNDIAVGDNNIISTANTIAIQIQLYTHVPDANLDYVFTSQELVIQALRVLVAQGKIDHTTIQFKYEDHIMSIDQHGYISDYPNGFCHVADDLLDQLLTLKAM